MPTSVQINNQIIGSFCMLSRMFLLLLCWISEKCDQAVEEFELEQNMQ